MNFVLRCAGFANGQPSPYDGQYLEWYNPNAAGDVGGWTADITKALKFPTAAEALAEWKRERTVDGLRLDGKPNRPLTAFNVEVFNYGD